MRRAGPQRAKEQEEHSPRPREDRDDSRNVEIPAMDAVGPGAARDGRGTVGEPGTGSSTTPALSVLVFKYIELHVLVNGAHVRFTTTLLSRCCFLLVRGAAISSLRLGGAALSSTSWGGAAVHRL